MSSFTVLKKQIVPMVLITCISVGLASSACLVCSRPMKVRSLTIPLGRDTKEGSSQNAFLPGASSLRKETAQPSSKKMSDISGLSEYVSCVGALRVDVFSTMENFLELLWEAEKDKGT